MQVSGWFHSHMEKALIYSSELILIFNTICKKFFSKLCMEEK